MMKVSHDLPPWIDPKTGKRYNNYFTVVPNTKKPITELTIDEFIKAMIDPPIIDEDETSKTKREKHRKDWYNYFCQIGWPEGHDYCQDGKYLISTGFPGMQNTANKSSNLKN